MNFEGGEIIIRLYSGNFHSPEKPELSDLLLAQTLTIKFADAELPQPALMKKWGGGLSKDAYGNYIYTLPRLRGRNGKLKSRGGGIFFPSYWWVFNNDGIKVGDPAQGHRNLYNWNTSKSSPEMETISFSRAGRMRRFHSPGMTILDYGNQGSDVVRTMVLRHSDYRHLSAKKEVPKNGLFPMRDTMNQRILCCIRSRDLIPRWCPVRHEMLRPWFPLSADQKIQIVINPTGNPIFRKRKMDWNMRFTVTSTMGFR